MGVGVGVGGGVKGKNLEDQKDPLYRRIVPLAPTAKTSVGEEPHTPWRFWDVGEIIGIQPVPSSWRIVPEGPTA